MTVNPHESVHQMTPSCDLPPPPATPPSAIAAMLNLLEPHLGQIATTFTTIDFIGRFSMTAVEGHQRLNELAEDGLITSVPGQAVETWQLTRDGAYVLSPNRKRVTKKFISDVKACLQSIGPELLRQGAVELSIGGRPLAEKPNGQVLVGLRLKSVPFASEADDGLLQQLCAALDAAVGTNGYAPMLFSEKVPLRLRDRTVIVANPAAARQLGAGGEELIDEAEFEQATWRARFRELHGLSDLYGHILHGTNLPWGLMNSLEVAAFAEDLPLQSSTSDWAPDDSAILTLCNAHPDTVKADGFILRSWSTQLFATLECRAAANSLPQFFEQISQSELTARDFYQLNPLFELARWDGGFERAAAHALLYFRTQLAETRAASASRVKPKTAPYYLLFFDTLNFPSPRLIGFVRQPAGHNAHVDELVDRWNTVLRGVDGTASSCLTKNGFNAGWLSLDAREATPDEEAVFHELCKREGTSFRYWLFLPKHRMAGRKAGRLDYSFSELDTPPIFRTATLGRAVEPRLLSPDYAERPALRDVVRAAPGPIRAAMEANIVFVDEESMSKFARRAALRPCIDPVVLSSKLLDAWTFSSREGEWSARAGGGDWSVILTAVGESLDLTVNYGSLTETYRLAPIERAVEGGVPYDDTLGALLGLFSLVRNLCKAGVQVVWAGARRASLAGDDNQKLQWLTLELYHALSGGGRSGGSPVDWPYFADFSSKTALVPDTSDS
jgi:PAS domain-containing protein